MKHKKKKKPSLITSRRKKAARELRKDQSTVLPGEEGRNASNYVMESGTNPDAGSSKYKYEANPTIFPEKGGKWKDLGGQGLKAYDEAKSRGETFGFKREKRAEKFAAGSWKKGQDRRDAMREYRKGKKK